MSAKKAAKTYQELETELRTVLEWFESDDFDVDEAVQQYRRGLELIGELEAYLASAENTVRELKAKFNAAE